MADAGPPASPRSILVVDDNDKIRQVLVDYVNAIGSEPLEASNGLQALWIVKQRRPDMVLLDLTMPRLGGFEAIGHIQKFDPSIRVIVITGDLSDETRREVERLGLEMLAKPFNLRALDKMLGRAALAS